MLTLFIIEIIFDFRVSRSRKKFFQQNAFSIGFLAVFSVFFIVNKALLFSGTVYAYSAVPFTILILRNLLILLKIFGRMRKLNAFIRSVALEPARTVLFVFLLIIITGTILLMMPFSSSTGESVGFTDALFTSTSAVCVTGLIVLDTPNDFSLIGQVIILLLIQIGGLGIMILSFFVVFVFRRGMTMEDKFLVSFVISESDMSGIKLALKRIIYLTFAIEGAGALLLFAGFAGSTGTALNTVFLSVFHSISAFCNAGFSLFSDSLEQFNRAPMVTGTVALLIILGGLSFFVIINTSQAVMNRLMKKVTSEKTRKIPLFLNSRIVLTGTAILIVSGIFLFYATEHGNTLKDMDVGTQYLSAFFQSVTLRTAGFNSVPFAGLATATYMWMMLFMFIGAASGSTAGGVKINSAAVLLAYIRSVLLDRESVIIRNNSIPKDLVLRAFLILGFGICTIFIGSLILIFTEDAPLVHIMFETVSAFGTVGLSAGLTPALTLTGKFTIIIIMFIGRLGPLTLLTAAVQRNRKLHIEYPHGEVTIG